jgi:hypothetical protein
MTSELARSVRSLVATVKTAAILPDAFDRARHSPLDAAAVAFVLQHRNEVVGRAVAEELAELLLVIRDPVDARRGR